jgi:ribonuclease D
MQSDFSNQFQICDRDLTPASLAQYLQSESLAVDTETMGLRPHRDRLCLVQLCDGQDNVTVLRIAQGQTEAPNLKQLLEAPSVTKIFHFARFDIATLRHYLGIIVQPLFCTKVASKLARTYSSRHGLKELIRELEGVDLDKTAQSSDWGNAAHLSEDQLRYAANDVRYLISARAKLIQILQREDRWELAQACFACLPTLAALDLRDFEQIFEH